MRKKESATFSANPGIGQTNLKLGGSHEYIYVYNLITAIVNSIINLDGSQRWKTTKASIRTWGLSALEHFSNSSIGVNLVPAKIEWYLNMTNIDDICGFPVLDFDTKIMPSPGSFSHILPPASEFSQHRTMVISAQQQFWNCLKSHCAKHMPSWQRRRHWFHAAMATWIRIGPGHLLKNWLKGKTCKHT